MLWAQSDSCGFDPWLSLIIPVSVLCRGGRRADRHQAVPAGAQSPERSAQCLEIQIMRGEAWAPATQAGPWGQESARRGPTGPGRCDALEGRASGSQGWPSSRKGVRPSVKLP